MTSFTKTKTIWWLCLALFSFKGADSYGANDHREKRIIFLTPARSGTHWMFYIMQHFSKRKVFHAVDSPGCRVEYNPFGFETVREKPPIVHFHLAWFANDRNLCYPIEVANRDKDIHLLIIRNPIEATIRQYMRSCGLSFADIIANYRDKFFEMVFTNLEFYDSWPKDRKLLVYYEDLMQHPNRVIPKIVEFIGESKQGVNEFLMHIDVHKSISLEQYRKIHGSTFTEGNDLTYHSRSLTNEQRQALYLHIKNTNPKLWRKYLSRYDALYQ